MDICFGNAPFSLFFRLRQLPEFMPLMARDRSNWPRCLHSHGWLPGLSLAGGGDPWAASFGLLAERVLEQVLGAYPADDSGLWTAGMLMILLWGWRNVPVSGWMVAGRIFYWV